MIPMTLLSGYLGAGKTTLINDILRDPKDLKLVVLVNEFGDINIDLELIKEQTDDAIALTNRRACCTINNDLAGALASIKTRLSPPDAIIIEASGVANLGRLKQATNSYPGFRLAQTITLVDNSSIKRLLTDKFVSKVVHEQIINADQLLLTKEDLLPCPLPVSALFKEPKVNERWTEREVFLENLGENLIANNESERIHVTLKTEHETHQQQWVELGDVSMQRLHQFLSSAPSEIVRMKGFITSEGKQFLVQADRGQFSIERSNVTDSKQGLQVIGTPKINLCEVTSKLKLAEN